MEKDFPTRCIHLDDENRDNLYGSMSFPIFQTANFAHFGVGRSSGYDYTRTQNPTKEHLEKIVAALENGIGAVAFASGMAAIDTALEIFKNGDHLIADIDLYGGSYRIIDTVCKKNGIDATITDLSKADIKQLITPKTKAIYIETPTNPMMHVLDIEKLAQIAHEAGAYLFVDNTFLTPYFQNPLELGADVVLHSGTKFLGGHNDTLCGVAITRDEELLSKIRILQNTKGNGIAPFDSWLIARGIETLPLRMEKAQENAIEIANWLSKRSDVTKVLYPKFASGDDKVIIEKQTKGYGSMITFEVETKELAYRILEKVKVIHFAESLGGTESLITYPITQTHKEMPKEILDNNGITDRVLRLSVGIESAKDLIEDLEKAFNGEN